MDKSTERSSRSLRTPAVKLKGPDGFKIQLEKLAKDDFIDQSDVVLDQKGQGCITNPGGPGC